MTRSELESIARRLYDAAYRVIIGSSSKGGNMSETQPETPAQPDAPDPRDARIAELEAQLAAAETKPVDGDAKAPADTTTPADTTAAEPEAPAEVTYEQAKAKVDANKTLTDADVSALERGPQG